MLYHAVACKLQVQHVLEIKSEDCRVGRPVQTRGCETASRTCQLGRTSVSLNLSLTTS